MKITEYKIEGLKLIRSQIFEDHRGFFTERYKVSAYKDLGLPIFIQDNFSYSKPNVLRGLHYQANPSQGKLVTCLTGQILDVAVDIRKNSPTYGSHQSVVLSAEKPEWFWIPAGFAHGFFVIGSEPASVLYKVDGEYSKMGEGSILWSDEKLGIQWPSEDPILTEKDKLAPSFMNYSKNPVF